VRWEQDTRDDVDISGPVALVCAALFLFACLALAHLHDSCLDRAAGDPVAVERCESPTW
jgi:hypothetical protein